MSIVGIPMLLGPVLGPALGGIIVDNFDWRWIFYVNVPIGLLALVLSARTLKSDPTGTAGKLDIVGFALLSPALAFIVYGLSEAGSSGGFSGTRGHRRAWSSASRCWPPSSGTRCGPRRR